MEKVKKDVYCNKVVDLGVYQEQFKETFILLSDQITEEYKGDKVNGSCLNSVFF